MKSGRDAASVMARTQNSFFSIERRKNVFGTRHGRGKALINQGMDSRKNFLAPGPNIGCERSSALQAKTTCSNSIIHQYAGTELAGRQDEQEVPIGCKNDALFTSEWIGERRELI